MARPSKSASGNSAKPKDRIEIEDDLREQILATAASYQAFFSVEVAAEFARNVLAYAPQIHALEAFLELAAAGMPRPSDVIARARELAAAKRRFPHTKRCLVFSCTSAGTGLDYEAVRELGPSRDARSAIRPGERYVDEITAGGDKYARWKAEWESWPQERRDAADRAKQRFYAKLGEAAKLKSFPTSPEPTPMSKADEEELVHRIEDEK